MRRLLLCLPALLAGVPLLAVLIAASSRNRADRVVIVPPPAVVVTQEGELPDNAGMERLAQDDPCAFLENCLRRYQRDVRGYTLKLQKQEFLGGSLQPREITDVC